VEIKRNKSLLGFFVVSHTVECNCRAKVLQSAGIDDRQPSLAAWHET
jgi:hypothetical protein